MRLGTLFLGVGLASLFVGALGGEKAAPKEPQFPLSLFAKATEESYLGDDACSSCHEDVVAKFKLSAHAPHSNNPKLPLGKRGCEGCHGPGQFHVDENDPQVVSYTKMDAKQVAAACLRCHGDTMKLSHWNRTDHAQAAVACTSCHQIHPKDAEDGKPPADALVAFHAQPTPKKLLKGAETQVCGSCHRKTVAQFKQNSHHPVPEGRMVCSDCHDVHPAKNARKDVDAVKGKCASCHADKAGPFVYEHDPVAGWTGDGCVECHKPHGSQNPKLLTSFSRGVCAQCHTDKLSRHYPGRSCWSSGCHVAVHGSNTDPRFLRR